MVRGDTKFLKVRGQAFQQIFAFIGGTVEMMEEERSEEWPLKLRISRNSLRESVFMIGIQVGKKMTRAGLYDESEVWLGILPWRSYRLYEEGGHHSMAYRRLSKLCTLC